MRIGRLKNTLQQCTVFREKHGGGAGECKHTEVNSSYVEGGIQGMIALKLSLSLEDGSLFTANFLKRKKNVRNHRVPLLQSFDRSMLERLQSHLCLPHQNQNKGFLRQMKSKASTVKSVFSLTPRKLDSKPAHGRLTPHLLAGTGGVMLWVSGDGLGASLENSRLQFTAHSLKADPCTLALTSEVACPLNNEL